MGGAHRAVLRTGDRVRLDGVVRTVTAIVGTVVRLTDEQGCTSDVGLVEVFTRGVVEEPGPGSANRLAHGVLAGLPEPVLAQARWWQAHLVEVITGAAPGAAPKALPRAQYDPQTTTVAQREAAKAAELTAAGHDRVSARTVRRRRQRYEAMGLPGLLDGRTGRRQPVRTDERVVDALKRAIEEAGDASSRTVSYLQWRVERILAAEYGDGAVAMPSQATFYRLFDRFAHGRHTTGSARTRQSMAAQPDTPYGVFTAVRPGELMQIDSSPLDIAVRLDTGVAGRVEMTGMIDMATRTVTAVILRPSTKSVDASLLLARTVTPEPMRPGWSQALAMTRSVLPHQHLLSVDERLAHAAARPVIVPECIVCDQGQVFISHNFRASCQQLGIDFQPCHPGSPAEKPHIEKMMSSVATLFAQYVSGYLGSSVERRGRHAEREPLWSIHDVQQLLDEWVVASWQNRPHDGLRDPRTPGRRFTPNEKYAALVAAAGYVPVALSGEDYIELLPATWRAINHYGVKVNHRTYDGPELDPLRRQRSGVTSRKDLWEVHRDPYDISRIWLRNHWDGGWITLFWKHLHSAPAPFGELAWNHALAGLRERGENPTEPEIAAAVTALLDRAARGPDQPRQGKPSKRDRRVAARTHATPTSLPPAAVPAAHLPPRPVEEPDEDGDEELAEVIPLGVFDARKEAQQWW
jgi:hypothetical protein